MIDAAIVGLGRWGQNLVNSVQGKSERLRFIRGVVRNPAPLREYAAARGIILSDDFAAMLADPAVQAVVLATPHSLHADQIVAVAAAGKPVYCEKPLALKRTDAERAVAACAKAGVLLAVGHDKRFWPSMQALTRIVASGELGEILHIEGHNSNETSRTSFASWRASPEESPGGGMTGTGVHMVDAFVGLIGPVKRVQAQLLSRRPPPDVLDTVAVLFEFSNGVSGTMSSIRATPQYWRAHVFGTKVSAEAIGPTELVIRKSGAAPQRLSFDPVDALKGELEAFADAVSGRAPYPITPPQMVETVAAFEAIVQSMETGKPVVVNA
jgi:predicted dehydrogenase